MNDPTRVKHGLGFSKINRRFMNSLSASEQRICTMRTIAAFRSLRSHGHPQLPLGSDR